MLEIQALACELPVLGPLSLSFPAGQLTVVLGPNGAGKSTLFNLIAGLQSAGQGEVYLEGVPLHGLPRPEQAQKLVVMTQQQPLDFPFSVSEVVQMGCYPRHLNRADEQTVTRQWLAELELDALAQRAYPSLSGGEQRRVQLARTLAQCGDQTRALLLDEPLTAMDLRYQHLCLEVLRRQAHHEGRALVVILHDLTLAARYADQLVLLKQGQLVASGTPEQVFSNAHLSLMYDLPVDVVRDEQGRWVFHTGTRP